MLLIERGDNMPQSDGKNILKRMEFEFDGKSFKFNINPEEYTQDEPSRSTITQTKAGAWIDDFGGGLVQIFMKGTTGMKNGFKKFKELRQLIRDYYDSITPGQKVKKELIFHNFTDEESWVVHPDPSGIKLFRSKTNPLLYMYELRLVCLRPARLPAYKDELQVIDMLDTSLFSSLAEKYDNQRQKELPPIENTIGVINTENPDYISRLTSGLKSFIDDLSILANGAVLVENLPLPESEVDPTPEHYVSIIAKETFAQLKSSSQTVNQKIPSDSVLGMFLALKESNILVPKPLETMFKTILLEATALYKHLVDPDLELSRNISERDMDRIIENIEWVTQQLTEIRRVPTELIEKLRELQLALSHLRSDNKIFNRNVKTKNRTGLYAPYDVKANIEVVCSDNQFDLELDVELKFSSTITTISSYVLGMQVIIDSIDFSKRYYLERVGHTFMTKTKLGTYKLDDLEKLKLSTFNYKIIEVNSNSVLKTGNLNLIDKDNRLGGV